MNRPLIICLAGMMFGNTGDIPNAIIMSLGEVAPFADGDSVLGVA